MAKWYYYNESGEKVGPITGKEFKQLAQQGTITPDTRVEDEYNRTALAKHVVGSPFYEMGSSESALLGQKPFSDDPSTVVAPPAANLFCMNCGDTVHEQAVACKSCGSTKTTFLMLGLDGSTNE